MAPKSTPNQPTAPTESPFAGLDYPTHNEHSTGVWTLTQAPSTAAIGPLAFQLRGLFGCSGKVALAASVLLDQGRVGDAFELLDKAEAEREAAAEAKRLAKVPA